VDGAVAWTGAFQGEHTIVLSTDATRQEPGSTAFWGPGGRPVHPVNQARRRHGHNSGVNQQQAVSWKNPVNRASKSRGRISVVPVLLGLVVCLTRPVQAQTTVSSPNPFTSVTPFVGTIGTASVELSYATIDYGPNSTLLTGIRVVGNYVWSARPVSTTNSDGAHWLLSTGCNRGWDVRQER
jgi:hypothetical protein